MGILSGITSKLKNKGPHQGGEATSYQDLLEALSLVKDPDLHKDIVSLGFVRNLSLQEGQVSFDLNLTTPACPVKEELKAECERVVKALPGIRQVEVRLTATSPQTANPRPQDSSATAASSLGQVKNILAVASGKGGVGKSTTAVNLAFGLAAAGAKVGLLDADVYGPSVPQMTGVGKPEMMEHNLVVPPTVDGVKMVSVSMFTSAEKAQILRGPMAGNLVRQFLSQVAWGELDYLLIDYPPGTGDIQLTISQVAPVTGAVIVTTPQEVALIDVRKAISMFSTMKVPVVGIIETMSYFVCDGCEKKHFIFRQGGGRRLSEQFGLPLLGEIPLEPRVSVSTDQGSPLVSHDQESLVAKAYQEACGRLAREVSILNAAPQQALSSFSLNWKTE